MTGKFRTGQIVVTNAIDIPCAGININKGTVAKIVNKDKDDTYQPYFIRTEHGERAWVKEEDLDIASPKEKAQYKR